jgi:hypothetical protein
MTMKRLMAGAAAATMVAVGFLASASPASAWTKQDCVKTWAAGKDHPDCTKYKTTTTEKKTTTTAKATTTTAKPGVTTTTTAVKGEVAKPKPPAVVKATPKFTG